MARISRKERLSVLTAKLLMNPNRIMSYSSFSEELDAAKSSLSEDIALLREIFSSNELGSLETVSGATGGVRFRPYLPQQEALRFLEELSKELEESSRLLQGGYLYISDILSNPRKIHIMSLIIAGEFYQSNPDFVLTMETKGIPVATMVAQCLDVPMVVARRTNKVYEGPAVNINYESNSSERIETMCLSRRAVKAGQRALIVDDFMREGCTAKGMIELMKEFGAEVVGSAFIIGREQNDTPKIQNAKTLLTMSLPENGNVHIHPSQWILSRNDTKQK